MRILHLAAGDLSGGAAKGSYGLHKALREIGINSRLLISGRDSRGDNSVIPYGVSQWSRLCLSIGMRVSNLPLCLYPRRMRWPFNTGLSGINLNRISDYVTADLVHLHWINGVVAFPFLRAINKPVVWTMRDMWPLTGGCHYSNGCSRYETSCGSCPQLKSTVNWDLSRIVAVAKCRSLPFGLQPVGISRWLSDAASASSIFANHTVRTISNNIDTRVFAPLDKSLARKLLGIPDYKKIILIGAQRLSDYYKGIDLFLEACRFLAGQQIFVVTFGRADDVPMASIPFPQLHLGFLADSVSLRLAYCSADLFVAPSRMEAFGKTLAESLACGVPVVCFDATGPKDIVDHRLTGYRAIPYEPSDLARGVDSILDLPLARYREMQLRCRQSALSRFDSLVIARQYHALYAEMLDR